MKKVIGIIAPIFIVVLFNSGPVQAVTTFSSYWLNSAGQPQGPYVVGSCEIHKITETSCADCTEQKMLAVAYGNGDCANICKAWRGSTTHSVISRGLFTVDLQKDWTHKSYQFWANGLSISQFSSAGDFRTIQVDKKCEVYAREVNARQWFCPQFGVVVESTNLFFNTFNDVDTQTLYSTVPGFISCFDANGNNIE